MEKPAETAYPIHGLLRRRWSPRAFADKVVETDKLRSYSRRHDGHPRRTTSNRGNLWRRPNITRASTIASFNVSRKATKNGRILLRC